MDKNKAKNIHKNQTVDSSISKDDEISAWAELDDCSSDEEWENDVEFLREENKCHGSNFYFSFRKSNEPKDPVLDEDKVKPKEHYQYFPPYLIPNSYLDYNTWNTVGFDGKRNQGPRKIKIAGNFHKKPNFIGTAGLNHMRTVNEINSKLEGKVWVRPTEKIQETSSQKRKVDEISESVNSSNNLDLLASKAFSGIKSKSSNFQPGYTAITSQQKSADEAIIRKNKEQFEQMQKDRRTAEVQKQIRAMNKLKNRDVAETMFAEAIETFSPVQSIFDTTNLPQAYKNPNSKHFEV